MSDLTPHIEHLIAGHIDGVLSDAESAEFAESLAADPSVALALAEAMRLDATIGAHCRGGHRKTIATPAALDTPTGWRIGPVVGSIAATLLLAAAAVAVYLAASVGPDGSTAAPRPVLATVTDSAGVAWRSEPLSAGDEVTASAVAIDGGVVEMTMRGGGDVRLIGATDLRLTGGSRVHLASGTIDVRSKPGFTVTLAQGVEVVDLGTEFTVTAYADGRSAVSVRQGQVRVRDSAGVELTLAVGLMAAIDDMGRLVVARSGGPFDADPRLVAMYRMTGDDERSGSLANHAIRRDGRFAATLGDGVNPATVPMWIDGPMRGRRAVQIASAASQQVRIADFADAGIDTGITVAAWIKLDRATPWQVIATQWEVAPTGGGFIHLSIHNGLLALHYMTDDQPVRSTPIRELICGPAGAVTPQDGWVHVAMTVRAGGDLSLYRNGTEVARDPYPADTFPAAARAPLVFGHKGGSTGPGFDGSLGPIAVFDAALSPVEIERLFESGAPYDTTRVADAENENP